MITVRLLFEDISLFPSHGGVARHLWGLADAMRATGHHTHVLVGDAAPDIHEYISVHTQPKVSWYNHVVKPVIFSRTVRDYLRDLPERYDAFIPMHPYYAWASSRLETPTVYIQASAFPLFSAYSRRNLPPIIRAYSAITAPQVGRLERQAMERSATVVVLSEQRKREVCSYYEFPLDRVQVVPAGVDVKRFCPAPEMYLREELLIPQDVPLVLAVARLSSEKNLAMLFGVLQTLSDAWLVLVGDGPQRKNLEIAAHEAGVLNRVRFVGFRSDVERFYRIADVFVLPSLYEGFGQVLVEAMASGVPCVAFRPGKSVIVASDEVIDDGISGYVPVWDPRGAALTEAIKTILTETSLQKRMGLAARQIALERYSWPSVAERMGQVIANAVG